MEIYYRWQLDVTQSFIEMFKLAILCVHKRYQGVHDVERNEERAHGSERTTEGEREEEGETECGNSQAFPTKKRKKWTVIQLFEMYKKEGLCSPKHKVSYSLAYESAALCIYRLVKLYSTCLAY